MMIIVLCDSAISFFFFHWLHLTNGVCMDNVIGKIFVLLIQVGLVLGCFRLSIDLRWVGMSCFRHAQKTILIDIPYMCLLVMEGLISSPQLLLF